MKITYPQIPGTILVLLASHIAVSLLQGIPAEGIKKLVAFSGIPLEFQYLSAMAGTLLLLLLAIVFAIRALFFGKVCIGKQCALNVRPNEYQSHKICAQLRTHPATPGGGVIGGSPWAKLLCS